MAGQIREMIEKIVTERSKGNPTLAVTTRTKLILKGFDSQAYTASSPDDAGTIARLKSVAAELNVTL